MYMSVYELTAEQLDELKEKYAIEVCDGDISWGELAAARDIPDHIIFEHYDGISFVNDDFWCSAGLNA